jgi:predicted 3-demethylubiquinone-9 3-methyltransferase (glyoxalase superfamily)
MVNRLRHLTAGLFSNFQLKDKYGLSWQIIPSVLPELLSDPIRSGRVTRAFLQMKKFDIAKLLVDSNP